MVIIQRMSCTIFKRSHWLLSKFQKWLLGDELGKHGGDFRPELHGDGNYSTGISITCNSCQRKLSHKGSSRKRTLMSIWLMLEWGIHLLVIYIFKKNLCHMLTHVTNPKLKYIHLLVIYVIESSAKKEI